MCNIYKLLKSNNVIHKYIFKYMYLLEIFYVTQKIINICLH